jgi:hypothetical protein
MVSKPSPIWGDQTSPARVILDKDEPSQGGTQKRKTGVKRSGVKDFSSGQGGRRI